MTGTHTIDYSKHGADILKAMEGVEGVIGDRGIDVGLHHLILLRASQINQCGYCVQMHTREARRDGETDRRLDHLIVWRHVDDYTDAEKAAFAWTEALTELHREKDPAPLRDDLRKHYSDRQISTLTGMVCMINLWNRLQRSNH